jgi:hypothetical protein
MSEEPTRPLQPDNHFDPLDSLNEEDIAECFNKADEKLLVEHDKELELQKSEVKVANQEYVVIAFVGKDLNQKTEKYGIKIFGAFEDFDGAKKHAEKLSKFKENKLFDLYVLEMYAWTRIPPDPKCIQDIVYQEKELDDLIMAHKREQYRSKEVFNFRKSKLQGNLDVNEFKKENKIEEESKIQNEEYFKKVMEEPLVLPKFELEDISEEETLE